MAVPALPLPLPDPKADAPRAVAKQLSARGPIVDVVRLVSILVVFAVHLRNSPVGLKAESAIAQNVWSYLARNGMYGVFMFFVVSGFLITRTILQRTPELGKLDLRDFYSRRAGRI